MSTPIELLVKETKAAFIIAKSDGTLDFSEVLQIAVALSQKIQKIVALSGSEKKSLLLLTIKNGFVSSGGLDSLPGFKDASPEVKQAYEDQLLTATSTAIDALIAAVSGKLDFRKPSSWKACLPLCMSSLQAVLSEKDQSLLKEAGAFTEKLLAEPVIEEKK